MHKQLTKRTVKKYRENKRIWSDEHINKLKPSGIGFYLTVKTSGLRLSSSQLNKNLSLVL